MKTFKLTQIKAMILALCFANISCSNGNGSNFIMEEGTVLTDDQEMHWNVSNSNQDNMSRSFDEYGSKRTDQRGLKLHPSINPQNGLVECHMPLPFDWKVDFTTWKGPKGESVKFLGSDNIPTNQRIPNTIEELIELKVKPKMFSNYRVDRIVPLKEVAMKDSRVQAKYYKYAPSNDMSQAAGVETTNMDNGDRALLVVHYLVMQSQFGSFASYRVHILESRAKDFEQAKSIVINALSMYHENDQLIAMYNQKEQAKLAANDRAFQSRMRSNQANFQAMQDINKTYSDISDMSHKGYMERSRASDYSQSRGVDAILGQETTYNPFDGNEVNMESGYDHYYMNTWGEYIGTNDQFYNPNMDANKNNQEWRKVNPR